MPLPVDIVMGVEESQGLADGVIKILSHALRVVVKGLRSVVNSGHQTFHAASRFS
jgi:hypothetical protein